MRLAVLADIHGNLPALEAVMADMVPRRVDDVVNLGDCVSGPLWPAETLAALRERDWPTVRGNHDRWVGTGRESELGQSDRYAAAQIGPEGRRWLEQLPPTRRIGDRVIAMHARPDDDDRYLVEDLWGRHLVRAEVATVRSRLAGVAADLVLTAHSHLQTALRLPDGPLIVNPGSVGCPAYEDDASDPPHVSEQGSPAARYAVLEWRPEGIAVELLSVPYDHEAAAVRAMANHRPGWAHALRTGFAAAPGGPA